MPNISVYVPAMQLNRITLFAKENKTSVSKLMTVGALRLINTKKQVNCGLCRQPAVGKFSIVAYDWNEGEQQKEVNLCEAHLKKARLEGDVIEL